MCCLKLVSIVGNILRNYWNTSFAETNELFVSLDSIIISSEINLHNTFFNRYSWGSDTFHRKFQFNTLRAKYRFRNELKRKNNELAILSYFRDIKRLTLIQDTMHLVFNLRRSWKALMFQKRMECTMKDYNL